MTAKLTRARLTAIFFSILRRILYLTARDVTELAGRGRTLVVAPHPDDETLGCGATIARVRHASGAVRVLIVADGRASHQSALISPEELVEIRAHEALAACSRLGVGAEHVGLLKFPDGHLAAHTAEIEARLLQELAAFAPEQLLYPSGLDGHADHQALAAAVENILAAGQAPPRAYAYPVWFWNFSIWRAQASPLRRFLSLRVVKVSTRGQLDQKRAALSAHRSQFENLTGEKGWQVLDSTFTRHFFGPYELFFEYIPS